MPVCIHFFIIAMRMLFDQVFHISKIEMTKYEQIIACDIVVALYIQKRSEKWDP